MTALRVALLEHEPPPSWRAGLDALRAGLAAAGCELTHGDADAWLIAAGEPDQLARHVLDRDPEQRRRTVLLGAALPWPIGALRHPPGSLPALLEAHQLGGAFTPPALTEWRELPSYFAGPRELMPRFHTSPIKALQSPHYAFWVHAPGASLAAFLIAYLPVLVERAAARDEVG